MISSKHWRGIKLVCCWVTRKFETAATPIFMTALTTTETSGASFNILHINFRQIRPQTPLFIQLSSFTIFMLPFGIILAIFLRRARITPPRPAFGLMVRHLQCVWACRIFLGPRTNPVRWARGNKDNMPYANSIVTYIKITTTWSLYFYDETSGFPLGYWIGRGFLKEVGSYSTCGAAEFH